MFQWLCFLFGEFRSISKDFHFCCQGWWPVVALANYPCSLQVHTSSFRGLARSKPRNTRFHSLRRRSRRILGARVFLTATFVFVGGEAAAPSVHSSFLTMTRRVFRVHSCAYLSSYSRWQSKDSFHRASRWSSEHGDWRLGNPSQHPMDLEMRLLPSVSLHLPFRLQDESSLRSLDPCSLISYCMYGMVFSLVHKISFVSPIFVTSEVKQDISESYSDYHKYIATHRP